MDAGHIGHRGHTARRGTEAGAVRRLGSDQGARIRGRDSRAAFLLSWPAEVFQLDVSQGLALALPALIAILPGYVVDATFA